MSQVLKAHVALNTPHFEESVRFYRAFLGLEPVKLKPGYAKFDVTEPPLNLTLNASTTSCLGALNHLGIQVASTEAVEEAQRRVEAAGLATPGPARPQGKDLASLADVRARWEEIDTERGRFLRDLTEAKLADSIAIKPTTGGEYRHSFGDMFRHAVDHSSYHRGQVVTLMRQLGVKPPSTGLILFCREQATGRQIANV